MYKNIESLAHLKLINTVSQPQLKYMKWKQKANLSKNANGDCKHEKNKVKEDRKKKLEKTAKGNIWNK